MRQIIIIFGLFFLLNGLFGQSQSSFLTYNQSYFYSKTDYNKIDSLSLWNYSLDTNYIAQYKESIRPIGKITFWRIKPLDDGISLKIYNQIWTPTISYEIFNMRDSAFCLKQSHQTRMLSSCVPSNVGGDIFIIGSFIFFNRNVCVSCTKYDSGQDYCRPIIRQIVDKVDKSKIESLAEIVRQFIIKPGKL
jgi:hypothetical protein